MSNLDKVNIGCPHCHTTITCSVVEQVSQEEDVFFLAECLNCKSPLLGRTRYCKNEWDNWVLETAERLWPIPEVIALNVGIPDAARRDIRDAQRCMYHGIYSATAVLCGRALERLVKDKVEAKYIGAGLQEMKAKGIIDSRMFDWAEIGLPLKN